MAKPMKHSDTVNGVASVKLHADFPHLGQRHRFVGFVFEVERRPAMRLVAYKPVERDDRAIRRLTHATNGGVHVNRGPKQLAPVVVGSGIHDHTR